MTVAVGDRIRNVTGETGIVCHLNPPVMRVESFHSYVIFNPTSVSILETAVDPTAFVRSDILRRIEHYIAQKTPSEPSDTPTGG